MKQKLINFSTFQIHILDSLEKTLELHAPFHIVSEEKVFTCVVDLCLDLFFCSVIYSEIVVDLFIDEGTAS